MKKLILSALCLGLISSANAQQYNMQGNHPSDNRDGRDYRDNRGGYDNRYQNQRPPQNQWNNQNNQGYHNHNNNQWQSRPAPPPPNRGNPNWNGHWRGNFHQDDRLHWQQGRWIQSRHNGVYGWWWIVGGVWYYYSQPIYPYPVMVVPPDLYRPGVNYNGVRYYCTTSRNYYPYVTSCRVAWQRR